MLPIPDSPSPNERPRQIPGTQEGNSSYRPPTAPRWSSRRGQSAGSGHGESTPQATAHGNRSSFHHAGPAQAARHPDSTSPACRSHTTQTRGRRRPRSQAGPGSSFAAQACGSPRRRRTEAPGTCRAQTSCPRGTGAHRAQAACTHCQQRTGGAQAADSGTTQACGAFPGRPETTDPGRCSSKTSRSRCRGAQVDCRTGTSRTEAPGCRAAQTAVSSCCGNPEASDSRSGRTQTGQRPAPSRIQKRNRQSPRHAARTPRSASHRENRTGGGNRHARSSDQGCQR